MAPLANEPDGAHGGSGWTGRSADSSQEIGSLWGACGQNSEYGKLLRVAMHRPVPELSSVVNAEQVHWSELPDIPRAIGQFDKLCEVYLKYNIDVIELRTKSRPTPNLMFMRDLFVMTPTGAILARPASDVRAGEEVIVQQFLAENRIPVLLSVSGNGIFEGPDLIFFDESSAFIGTGIRTNEEGARQVEFTLQSQGINVSMIQTTYGCGHLDGVLSIVGHKKAVLFPKRVSYKAYQTLRHHGYSIIPLPDPKEGDDRMAINMVALEPNLVLIPAQTPKMQMVLKEHGISTIEVDVSELMKAGGAMHCLTGIVQRELV
jgi:arginine deiminase